jgi:hypothetical protein
MAVAGQWPLDFDRCHVIPAAHVRAKCFIYDVCRGTSRITCRDKEKFGSYHRPAINRESESGGLSG